MQSKIVIQGYDQHDRGLNSPLLINRSQKVVGSIEQYAYQRSYAYSTVFPATTLTAFTGLIGQTALLTFGEDLTQSNNFNIYSLSIVPRTLPAALEQFGLYIYQGQSAIAGGVNATTFNLNTSANTVAINGHYKNTGTLGSNISLVFPAISGFIGPTGFSITQNNYNLVSSGLSGKATNGNKVICIGSTFNTTATFDISVVWGYDSSI